MAYTLEQYNSLKDAYAKGELVSEIRYSDGRSVKKQYRSLPEMRAILTEMEMELGITPKRNNHTVASFRRGL